MTNDGEVAVRAAVDRAAEVVEARRQPRRWRSHEAIADDILKQHRLVADRQGRVYQYDGRYWRRFHPFELQRLIWTVADSEVASSSRRKEVAALVALKVAVPDLRWGRLADREIACRNGVLDLLINEIRPHRPEDYLEQTLAQEYDPGALCPTWLECLETWFRSADDDRATALQDFAGYVCMNHAKYKKALLLYGPGDTGKSVFVRALQQLVGPEACCSLSVESMDDPVRLTAIRGKQLNVCSELSGRALVRDSGFKTLISTEEPVFLNPKYENPEMYLPPSLPTSLRHRPPLELL